MLKKFTEDTSQGDGVVIGRVCFVPLFENRGNIGFFPSGREFATVKGFLVDQLQDGGKFFV